MKNQGFTFYENTIVDNIDLSGYGLDNDVYLYDKVKTLYNIFKREYLHDNNKHQNEIFLFSEWLRGLPSALTVPFENYLILQNALANGYNLDSEEKENDFLEKYWLNLANAFYTLKDNL